MSIVSFSSDICTCTSVQEAALPRDIGAQPNISQRAIQLQSCSLALDAMSRAISRGLRLQVSATALDMNIATNRYITLDIPRKLYTPMHLRFLVKKNDGPKSA